MAGATILLASLGAPAAAQEATVEVVAQGLNAPRGVAVADDGSIYVAEAGTAGETCLDGAGVGDSDAATCYGPTGAIARVSEGVVERVVAGLSSAGSGPEVGGISDVAVAADGTLYAIIGLGSDPATRAGMPTDFATAGWLLRGTVQGGLQPVADVAALETTADPDAASGGEVDFEPQWHRTRRWWRAVADAGGNSLLMAADDGSVSLIAAIPFTTHEFSAADVAAMGPPPEGDAEAPADGEAPAEMMVAIPVQPVPTSVALGPDGALYVGELTGGPFPVGGASVWRVADGEEPTQYATGFSSIMGLDFGPDGTLYVAEMVHDGLMGFFTGEGVPVGAVMSVAPGGGEPTMVASGEQLMALGGLDVGADGSIYVTTGTIMGPGAGALVRVTP